MRKILALFFVLSLSSFAVADEKAKISDEKAKIGFVDLQRALNESEAGKASKSELEDLIKKKQEQIDKKIKEKNRLQEEFERQSSMLSEEAARKRMDEIEEAQRDAERMISDSNAEVQKRQREKEIAILKNLDDIINKLGTKEKYTIILPAEVILFSSEGVDLTDVVIEKFNALKTGSKNEKEKK
jgi:outer membrane protein